MCIGSRAPHCRTVLQNDEQDKIPKASPRSNLSWNTCQDFLKIPSLWEAALETERRCFSKVILKSNVTPNITRSSDSISTVLPIVNGGNWGCILNDLETIIVLVIFIPRRSHHSLTLPRSLIEDYATETNAWGWHNSHQSGVVSITDQLVYQNGKRLWSVQEEQWRVQNTARRHSWHNGNLFKSALQVPRSFR